MIEIKRQFSRRELLWFGPLFALFGGMMGGLAKWKFEWPEAALGIWGGSLGLILLYYLCPPLQKRIFAGWLAAVFPLGWVVSHVLLALVFYGLVFPTGLLMRLLGHDPLGRHFDREADSYWIPTVENPDPKDYFRQF